MGFTSAYLWVLLLYIKYRSLIFNLIIKDYFVRHSLHHQRSRSMGTGNDFYPVPSPTLTRGRAYVSTKSRLTSVGSDSRSG